MPWRSPPLPPPPAAGQGFEPWPTAKFFTPTNSPFTTNSPYPQNSPHPHHSKRKIVPPTPPQKHPSSPDYPLPAPETFR